MSVSLPDAEFWAIVLLLATVAVVEPDPGFVGAPLIADEEPELLDCVAVLVPPDPPLNRLVMSFQLVVEHPPNVTMTAPARAPMRNFDVFI